MAQTAKLRFAYLAALAWFAGLGASLAVGCGSDDHVGAWAGGGGEGARPGLETCADGATRDCHVTLDERNGILTCLQGTQTCTNGYWPACSDGTVSEKAAPAWYGGSGSTLRPFALSTPGDCNPENPCDPSCQQYDEDAGFEAGIADGGLIGVTVDWQWGSLADFPGGLVSKGMNEPCSSGFECQYNMYCLNPDGSSCSHDLCNEGIALVNGCDGDFQLAPSCTSMICDIEPSCCAVTTDPCTHDPCLTGEALKAECDPCVTDICDVLPECCDSDESWSADCVKAVADTCGNSCECQADETYNATTDKCYRLTGTARSFDNARNDCQGRESADIVLVSNAAENSFLATTFGTSDFWINAKGVKSSGSWSWKQADGSTALPYNNWGTTPGPNSGSTAYAGYMDAGSGGDWQASSAAGTSLVAACEGSISRMVDATPDPPSAWSADCVEMVQSVCGARCDSGSSSQGECVGWLPTEVDETCNGDGSEGSPNIDLSVAPTCGGLIPVCNHGTGEAPAGIMLVSFQGYSSHYPLCDPVFSAADVQDTCFTTEPIPAGGCIEVTDCELDNNGGVLINPHSPGLDPVPECSCAGNWSLVHPSADCGDPNCGSDDGFHDELAADCVMPLPGAEYEQVSRVILQHVYDDGDAATTEAPLEFTYVGKPSACNSSSWYFDDPTNPTTIELCDDACARVQDTGLASSRMYLELSCEIPPTYESTSFLQTYTGTCGADRGVQWMNLGFAATIPLDAEVVWRVAAASSMEELPPNDATDPRWSAAITATSASPDCPVNSSCDLDVFNLLGGLPDAQLPYLAVLVTLVPTASGLDAPVITDFDLTYSCPFNQ